MAEGHISKVLFGFEYNYGRWGIAVNPHHMRSMSALPIKKAQEVGGYFSGENVKWSGDVLQWI